MIVFHWWKDIDERNISSPKQIIRIGPNIVSRNLNSFREKVDFFRYSVFSLFGAKRKCPLIRMSAIRVSAFWKVC